MFLHSDMGLNHTDGMLVKWQHLNILQLYKGTLQYGYFGWNIVLRVLERNTKFSGLHHLGCVGMDWECYLSSCMSNRKVEVVKILSFFAHTFLFQAHQFQSILHYHMQKKGLNRIALQINILLFSPTQLQKNSTALTLNYDYHIWV